MKADKVDPQWLKDMRTARALAGVILLGFDAETDRRCLQSLFEIKARWGAKYDPSGFGLNRSDIAILMERATPQSAVEPIEKNISTVWYGKRSPVKKSRKGSRSTI